MNYFMLIFKCILFYFIIICSLRLMGKREVGELSVFDIVIYLVMSELLALSLSQEDESILRTLSPLITWTLLQIIVSKIILKNQKIRNILDGAPVLLIKHGLIDQDRMRKERYNLDDLMLQLRSKSIASPFDAEFAILESNGSLSVLEKNHNHAVYPFPLIQDGKINHEVLQAVKFTELDLINTLHKQGINTIEDCFLCCYLKQGIICWKKEASSKR